MQPTLNLAQVLWGMNTEECINFFPRGEIVQPTLNLVLVL